MQNKTPLFCQFSGYTKGRQKLINVTHTDEIYHFTLTKPTYVDLRVSDNIQLDGVLCIVSSIHEDTLIATTNQELVENTLLASVIKGDLISLGVCSLVEDVCNRNYPLQASSQGIVTLINSHTQPEQEHSLQLDFECDAVVAVCIENDRHIGLAGSSLFVRNLVRLDNGKQRFSIFCWPETREKTCFNDDMKLGTQVNITEATI